MSPYAFLTLLVFFCIINFVVGIALFFPSISRFAKNGNDVKLTTKKLELAQEEDNKSISEIELLEKQLFKNKFLKTLAFICMALGMLNMMSSLLVGVLFPCP